MTNRGNQPAYSNTYKNNDGTLDYESGMTIREKIAAQNMASLSGVYFSMSSKQQKEQEKGWGETYGGIAIKEALAKDAILLTDALIAELSKPTEK